MQAQLQANIHRPVPVVVIDVQGRFLKKFVTPQSWDPWAPGSLLGCQVVQPPPPPLRQKQDTHLIRPLTPDRPSPDGPEYVKI